MSSPIRILHLEDEPHETELVDAMLAGEDLACEIVRVETRADFLAALEKGGWDLVLSDNSLPTFNGMDALALTREQYPDLPFIFLSGTMGEEVAIDSLQSGATDYVLKHRSARLIPGVRRALKEAQERAERKRAEEALQRVSRQNELILSSAAEGIYGLDLQGRTIFVNPAAARMIGWAVDDLLGKSLHAILHHSKPDRTLYPQEECPIYATCMDGAVHQVGDEVFWRKDGTCFPVEYTSTPIRDEHGMIVGAVVTFRDVTERKKLEEQLRQSQKMEAIGQLTGGIAHDFNNLLTIINGYSEMTLQLLKADDPLRSNVEAVRQAGERAASLTRQLLTFSRRQVLEPKVLDLNAVVTNIDKMLQRLIGEDIDLVPKLQPGLGRVKVDPGEIEQVIMNLAVNARDAMPQGGKLTIATKNVELDENYTKRHVGIKPGPYVMLAVSDNGCGMDKATQKRIFEPFFTTKEKGKGTGLGLATVYGIVKQSSGSIWMYSEVGGGTVFKIYLPMIQGDAEAIAPKAGLAKPLRGSETVLVVEDQAEIRQLISKVLKECGYVVLEAGHGKAAFRISGRYEGMIHLMITDLVMPVISGRELRDRLASARPNMKVLFISGYTDDAVLRHGILEKGVAFIQKPFTPDSLLRKVREVLDASTGG